MAGTRCSVVAVLSNRSLRLVASSSLLFVLAEYGVWIAMLVYAYQRGGATTAGVVAVVQLVPGILIAPAVSTYADSRSPVTVLLAGYAAQTVGLVLTALILFLDGPAPAAYAAATFASTAVITTRPAQAALTPALARTADELSATNVVLGWLENVGIMLSSALAGLALSGGEPGLVFALGAGATALAGLLLTSVRVTGLAAVLDESGDGADEGAGPGPFAAAREGMMLLRDRPQPRLLVGLVTAEYVVIGALDLLLVVIAISVLHAGPQWSGYLNTAYGVGGVLAGALTLALLGRRLLGPILAAAALLGAAMAVTAFSHNAVLTLLLLGVVGLGRAVLHTATYTLLQRTVPPELLGRVFGVVESLADLGLAAGSLLVPLLTALGGTTAALVGTAAVIPLALLAGGRAVRSLDTAARVPVVEIALLRAMPHFRALPPPALEGLAQSVSRREFADREVIMRQGDPGDVFYAIAEGRVAITVDGRSLGTRQRPEGLGEIALLYRVPRTATVIADGPVVLYGLDGTDFVTVVTGHEPTARRAAAVAAARLGTGDALPKAMKDPPD